MFNHISYVHLILKDKSKIKDVKLKGDPKVMAYLKIFGMKEKKFSHIRGLSQSPKVYLNLKKFIRA